MEKIKKIFELEYVGDETYTESGWIDNTFKDVEMIRNVYKFKKYKDYTLKYNTDSKNYLFSKKINDNSVGYCLCKTEDEMIDFLMKNIEKEGGF